MNRIELDRMPAGTAIEIIQADLLPVRQETAFKYLCIDEQDRLVTTASHTQLVGGADIGGLMESLKRLGYAPFFVS